MSDNNITKRRRIFLAPKVAIAIILILSMSVAVYAIVKSIPINVTNEEAPFSLLVEGSDDPTAHQNFTYVIPNTPEGFEEVNRFEQPLSLQIVYENAKGDGILYSQSFGEEGQANLNIPNSDKYEVREETINDRKAIITCLEGELYTITIENGTSVFMIHGGDYDAVYNMAWEVTSAK